jgi:hypothetical protein
VIRGCRSPRSTIGTERQGRRSVRGRSWVLVVVEVVAALSVGLR